MAWLLAPLALLIERVAGYPPGLFKLVGHPVTWMGALIGWLEPRLHTGGARRGKGVIMQQQQHDTDQTNTQENTRNTRSLPFGWVIEAVLASTLIAQKELG